MKILRANLRIPAFMLTALRPLIIGNSWPEAKCDYIAGLIEEEDYDQAERLIAEVEHEYGVSTQTVRLSTMIDRIRILGR